MRHAFRAASAAIFVLGSSPLLAAARDSAGAQPVDATDEQVPEDIVVTGARTKLPITALPLTVDIVGGKELTDQVAISGSVIDAVAARLPAFSPTREKLSGSGETLRGRSPLYAINGVPQSTPIRDGSRDGFTIDPFFIDRVEVIYGSNALQGIGATGGVVNQVTVGAPAHGRHQRANADPGNRPGRASTARRSAARWPGWPAIDRGAFDVTGGAAFERRGVFLDGDGRRIGIDGTQGDIQDSDSWSLFGRLGYQLRRPPRLELIANRFELEGRGHYVAVAGNRADRPDHHQRQGRSRGRAAVPTAPN